MKEEERQVTSPPCLRPAAPFLQNPFDPDPMRVETPNRNQARTSLTPRRVLVSAGLSARGCATDLSSPRARAQSPGFPRSSNLGESHEPAKGLEEHPVPHEQMQMMSPFILDLSQS